MRKVWVLSLASFLFAAPSAMAAEIWSDVIYTEQSPTPSSAVTQRVFYPTYDEVKSQGCQDAKFSLGEGWYCKDPVQQNNTPTPVEESTNVGNQSSGTILWSEPPTTQNWTEAEITEQWTEVGPLPVEQSLSFTVDPFIEGGVIYAPVEEAAPSLGLAIMPLSDPKGIAVIKGEEEILYFFPGQSKYVLYHIATDKMEAFALPKSIQQKGTLTIVPIDIMVEFAGGSMNYNAQQRKVTLNNLYTFPVTAQSTGAYTQQWTEPEYTEQWTEPQYTEQWTEPEYTEQWTEPDYTEQWADTPSPQQWADTSQNNHWSENYEVPVPEVTSPAPSGTSWGVYMFQTDPINEKGRLLVPLRELFEMLGATVDWNAQTKSVTAKKQSITVQLSIGSKTAYVNGQTKVLDVPGRIVNGKTMIPLRFVSEAFGEKVNYDAKKLEVTVGTRTIFLPKPNTAASKAPASSKPSTSNSNVPYGGMTDQQWETQKILDRFMNNSFNMTGTYRPSYQWNSGY